LSKDPEADGRKGVEFAQRALEVAGDDPGVLANAALALAWFGEDIGAMVALVDRALALNSTFARGWYISGILRWLAGQADRAIEHVEVSLRLSPRARIGAAFLVIGGAHFITRRFEEAVPKLLLAIQEDPNYPAPIASSPPAMAIWGGSTKHEMSSHGSVLLPASWCRQTPAISGSRSTASSSCRACA
jgi:tetratricopeptide (TPR) repeat protein